MMRLDEEKLVLKRSSNRTQQSTMHNGDPWGKKMLPGGTVMWAGGTSTRQKSAGEKSLEINTVARSSDDQRVWESC